MINNIINNLKTEIYSNKNFNWNAILFILSEPIALFGAFMMFERCKSLTQNPKQFVISTYLNVIAMFIAITLRIPYMLKKPTAILFLIINAIAWGLCLFIWSIAFYRFKNIKI